MKSKPNLSETLKTYWLLVGIFTCIFLASIFPSLGIKGGPLRPEYTVKYGAVSIIFFISGLLMETDSIYCTLKQHRLHLFIQGYTFIFIPIFVQLLVVGLNILGIDEWLLKGLITAACMPPPVSSAAILTKSAQGNETAAIFNCIIGSFLGIFITPLSLLFNLGFTTIVPLLDTIVQLSLTVLLPLVLGQVTRQFTEFKRYNMFLNALSQFALLLIIYSTFCDTFHNPDTGLYAIDIFLSMILVILIQMLLLLISFFVARCIKYFSPADIVCIVFCSTSKSLTLGIPILRIMFHGLSHLSQISLPLLVYHPTQLILGGLLVSNLKDWVNAQCIKKPPV